jgi:hypothetical protein
LAHVLAKLAIGQESNIKGKLCACNRCICWPNYSQFRPGVQPYDKPRFYVVCPIRVPGVSLAMSDTPVLNRSEIRRFKRLLLPFCNQVAERTESFRAPCQRCLLGWMNLTWTARLAKTDVRRLRRLEIGIFRNDQIPSAPFLAKPVI